LVKFINVLFVTLKMILGLALIAGGVSILVFSEAYVQFPMAKQILEATKFIIGIGSGVVVISILSYVVICSKQGALQFLKIILGIF